MQSFYSDGGWKENDSGQFIYTHLKNMFLFNYFFHFRAVVNLLENQNLSKTIKKLAKKRSLCNMEKYSLLLRRKILKIMVSPPEATVFSPFALVTIQEIREHKVYKSFQDLQHEQN